MPLEAHDYAPARPSRARMSRLRPRPPAVLLLTLLLLAASAPLLGAAGADPSPLPPGVQALPDGGYAVPLLGVGPAWNTPEVRQKAIEAGRHGMGYDFGRDEAVPLSAAYTGHVLIRPGTMILPETLDNWCTAAFVYGGSAYVSTAGHCTRVGERVVALAAPTVLVAFGTTVESVDAGIGADWALIHVDFLWRWAVDADVAWWGGPCGSVTTNDITRVSTFLAHSGHGYAYGPGVGTPRTATLVGLDSASWTGVGFVAGGDSGSAIVSVGPIGSTEVDLSEDATFACPSPNAALGIITHGYCTLWPCAVVHDLFFGTRVTLVPGTPDQGDLVPVPLSPVHREA